MVYRNKTYVAFDGDSDMRYYNLMKAWKQSDATTFNFYDAHDINTALDSSSEETIKRRLSERMASSKMFVLLVGQNTYRLTKFVKWEVQHAIKLQLPIIAVKLDSSNIIPGWLSDYPYICAPFEIASVERAMTSWPAVFPRYYREGKKGPFYYND